MRVLSAQAELHGRCKQVADDSDHAARAIDDGRARGAVIEHEAVVPVVHFERRRAGEPLLLLNGRPCSAQQTPADGRGVFIPRLAGPDAMVITAADAQHPSFGREDRAKWTYFGDAFFNVALRTADNLQGAFVRARALVRERETREGFTPSNPQMAGGENVQPLLVPRVSIGTGSSQAR